MCNDVVEQVVLLVSCSLHCEFTIFLELVVGCTKMGLEIDPILLNWIHLVPGFDCVLEFPRPVNNFVGNVGHLGMGVRGSSQLPVF